MILCNNLQMLYTKGFERLRCSYSSLMFTAVRLKKKCISCCKKELEVSTKYTLNIYSIIALCCFLRIYQSESPSSKSLLHKIMPCGFLQVSSPMQTHASVQEMSPYIGLIVSIFHMLSQTVRHWWTNFFFPFIWQT